MQDSKLFCHIEYFSDSEYSLDTKNNRTTILFVVNHSIEPNILDEILSYHIEIHYKNIVAKSIPAENIITRPFKSSDVRVYIQVKIEQVIHSFSECNCFLYKNDKIIGNKKISLGFKIRRRVVLVAKSFLNKVFIRCSDFFTLQKKPIVSIHLWNLDIALDMLKAFKCTSRICDLRVVVPINLDKDVLKKFVSVVENNYHFNKIFTLEAPAVGRDVGGFITSLVYSLKSPAFNSCPHLFIHTKNTPGLPPVIVKRWRDSLVYDIAFNFHFFISLVLFKIFNAAIIYSKSNDSIENGCDDVPERNESYHLARKIEHELFDLNSNSIRFCLGTMMWVLPSRLDKVWSIKNLEKLLSKLEPSVSMSEPSYGHAFERAFPDVVRRMGLKVFSI